MGNQTQKICYKASSFSINIKAHKFLSASGPLSNFQTHKQKGLSTPEHNTIRV